MCQTKICFWIIQIRITRAGEMWQPTQNRLVAYQYSHPITLWLSKKIDSVWLYDFRTWWAWLVIWDSSFSWNNSDITNIEATFKGPKLYKQNIFLQTDCFSGLLMLQSVQNCIQKHVGVNYRPISRRVCTRLWIKILDFRTENKKNYVK